MLNLKPLPRAQTPFVEAKAWIIVTAQEALDKVVGDMDAQQSNDFQKFKLASIFDAFDKRECRRGHPKAPSKETEPSEDQLNSFMSGSGNFGTLFGFADGSVDLKNF